MATATTSTTVTDMVSTALSAIRRERHGVETTEVQHDDHDFTSTERLYRRTLNTFTPRSSSQGVRRLRGRPTQTVKIKMFLVDAPTDILPSVRRRKRLDKIGLGTPKMPSYDIIRKSFNVRDLQNHIVSLYPGIPLELVGFHVAKCTKARLLIRVEIENVMQLKKEIGKGILFIIPKNVINIPPPLQENVNYHQDDNSSERPATFGMSSTQDEESNVNENEQPLSPSSNSRDQPSTPVPNSQEQPCSPLPTSNQPPPSTVPNDGTSPQSNTDTTLPVILAPQRCRRMAARNARRAIRRWCNRPSTASPLNARPQSLLEEADEESLIEIVDSEDEALQLAVEASLQEQPSIQEPILPLSEVLRNFKDETVKLFNTTTSFIIMRRKVLDSSFLAMRRQSFSPVANLYVKFSGEMGEDYGGPRREYFRLVIRELQQSCLFEGNEGNKFFTHNLEALEANKYFMAGQILAMSLLQEGPGLHCLNLGLYQLMTGKALDNFDIDGLPDTDAREILTELKNLKDYGERDSFLVKHGEWLMDRGFMSAWRLDINNKDQVVSSLVKQIIFYRCHAEIASFVNGINSLNGMWNVIKENNTAFMELFCHVQKSLGLHEFRQLYKILWSDEGSNKRIQEEETIFAWELFLQAIEEKEVNVTFGDLLAFISGADHVPPLGFSQKIEINFFPVEIGITRLPFVSTCALSLSLPREVENHDTLKNMLVRSIKESKGFHKI